MKESFIAMVFIFIAGTLIMYVFQRHLIYFPAKEMPSRQKFHAEMMQDVKIKTEDGLELHSWYKKPAQNKPVLLYLHGNGGHIGFRMALVQPFINAGYGVLLLEYRGYGGNKGYPSEQGLYLDGQAAIKFLEAQGLSSKNVVLYGESLGTGVATELATKNRVCAVILQAPFTSLAAVAGFHYPWIIISPWDKFNSIAKIANIQAPLLILHGDLDQVVPFVEGQILFKQAKQPKKFVQLSGKGHNNTWDEDFFSEITLFIQKNCPSIQHKMVD